MLSLRLGLLGWATGRLIEHDARAPGAIRRLLCSGPARRQAVYALIASELAAERHEQIARAYKGDADIERSEIVRDGGAREVLAELLGREPPDGLKGALERVGLNPLIDPRLYAKLIELYTDPAARRPREALKYVGQIRPVMIRAIDILPTCLLHHNVLTRLTSMTDAHGVVEAVQFAKSVNSRATDEVILEAVARMREEAKLEELIARFIRRADRPLAAPIPADEDVWPVQSVVTLVGTARHFRNCLATERKVVGALRGRAAYAVLRGEVVMEFLALSTGAFLFVGAHGKKNGAVSPELHALARSKCVAAGVPFVPANSGGDGVFGGLVDPYDPVFLELAA